MKHFNLTIQSKLVFFTAISFLFINTKVKADDYLKLTNGSLTFSAIQSVGHSNAPNMPNNSYFSISGRATGHQGRETFNDKLVQILGRYSTQNSSVMQRCLNLAEQFKGSGAFQITVQPDPGNPMGSRDFSIIRSCSMNSNNP